MIADDIRLPASQPAAPAGHNCPLVTPQNARVWRLWAQQEAHNGQVTLGLDLFLDMLDQITAGQG